jgi:site-specific DNA-adenine methylase
MAGLRQFFSYFGSKVALAKHYPAPEFDTIIEPFAGSAGYACLYHERDVRLFDIDPVIVGIWEYLIAASERDILGLPLDVAGVKMLSKAERDFIGFWNVRCGSHPQHQPTPWSLSGLYPSSFWSERTRVRIAGQVEKISHWKVTQGSYAAIPNAPATWFIDSPYEAQGKRYAFGSSGIDYAHLAAWVRERSGQKIVCEDAAATWLPFTPLYENRTVKYNKAKRTISEGCLTIPKEPPCP